MSFVSAKRNKDIETRGRSATQDTPQQQHSTDDTGWNCPAHASPRMQGNSVPFCAQRGPLLHSPLPCTNVTSPARNAQLWSPPSKPFPAPVPRLSFWRAGSLNPSSTTSMLAKWDAPAVNRSASSSGKEEKMRTSQTTHGADSKHHTGQDQPLPQQSPPQKHQDALLLTCSFRSRTLQP